ncbi:hypothetical protein Tco_0758740 [Tanacetum coccineum]
MYHDLYLGGRTLVERENVGLDLTKSDLCPSFVEDHPAKGVGLRVADSHTGSHREDGFTPLETIQRFLGIIGSRSLSGSKGRPLSRREECEEFSDFLSVYPIPSEYKVMLPKRNQTIFDAPDGYVGLYTHCFSLANLRLPLPKFFYDVLQYFKVHLSRLNPFGDGYTKLTTFVVMCKAYGCEPTVELFRGFFNLFPGVQWLTFAKRPEKHIPNLLPKVITRIEGWKGRFFFVQDSIIRCCLSSCFLKKIDGQKIVKDKLPDMIHENPSFQRLGRYPINVWTFPDPILF